MDKHMTPNEIEFAEKLMELVDMEVMARHALDLPACIGNEQMMASACEDLRRATELIAAHLATLGGPRYRNSTRQQAMLQT